MPAGLSGDIEVSELCRREGINPTQYYGWKKKLTGAAGKVFANGAQKPDARERRLDRVTPGSLAAYAARMFRSGRRFAGSSSTDALSPQTRMMGRATVVSTSRAPESASLTAALSSFSSLEALAGDPENLGAIRDLFDQVNAKLFLDFETRMWGKREVRKVSSGVLTLGDEPAPIEVHKGRTDKEVVKQQQKKVRKTCRSEADGPPPEKAGRRGLVRKKWSGRPAQV